MDSTFDGYGDRTGPGQETDSSEFAMDCVQQSCYRNDLSGLVDALEDRVIREERDLVERESHAGPGVVTEHPQSDSIDTGDEVPD